jgi:hypothetical protein
MDFVLLFLVVALGRVKLIEPDDFVETALENMSAEVAVARLDDLDDPEKGQIDGDESESPV